MPRTNIRSLARILLGLTSDSPDQSPPLSDEVSLVERLGDSRLSLAPAFRPIMAGAVAGMGPPAAGLHAVVQVRAGVNPIYVTEFALTEVTDSGVWRAGPDLITAGRTPLGNLGQWSHPPTSAIAEIGTTAVGIIVIAGSQDALQDEVIRQEIYLEPGEVLSFHHLVPQQALEARFQWYEVP